MRARLWTKARSGGLAEWRSGGVVGGGWWGWGRGGGVDTGEQIAKGPNSEWE